MRSVSAVTLLTAIGAVVNAAPALDKRQMPETHNIAQKAPFQEEEKLPVLASSHAKVSFDMTGQDFGYSPTSDEYKCHGSCGIVNRISRVANACEHPYAWPFVDFCFNACANLKNFSPYPTAKDFKKDCGDKIKPPTTTRQVTSTSAEAPASTSSSRPASPTSASVSRPTGSAAPSGSSSSASASRTSAPPTGTPVIPRPSHPSGVGSASGTVASTTPRATPTNAGPVTAGAASTSLSVIAAITVATLAIVIA